MPDSMEPIIPEVQQPTTVQATPQQFDADQFNAIRQRAEAVQQPRMFADIVLGDKKQTIFSTDGKPKTDEQFQQAIDMYNEKKGALPPGFVVHPEGVTNKLRKGFEAFNSFGQGINKSLSESGIPGVTQVGQALSYLDKDMTPGKAGAVALTTALGGPTGAYSNILRQVLKGATAGATGSAVADIATGTPRNETIENTLVSGISSGTAQGVLGVLGKLTRGIIGPEAEQSVLNKLSELIKSKYPALTNDPAKFQALASTPRGLNDIINITTKGIQDTSSQLNTQFKKDLRGILDYSALSDEVKTDLTKSLSALEKHGTMMLQPFKSTAAFNKAKATFNDLGKKVATLINDNVDAAKTGDVTAMLMSYGQHMKQLVEGAEGINAIRLAHGDKGLTVRELQQQFMDKFKAGSMITPGSVTEDISKVAFRGGSPTSGIDMPSSMGKLGLPSTLTNKFPALSGFNVHVPFTSGMNSVGNVSGANNPAAAGTRATVLQSMQDFISDRERK